MRLKLTDSAFLLLLAAVATSLWLLDQPPWRQALTLGSFIIAAFGWWWLFVRRRSCGAPTTRGGGCQTPVRGAFAACWRPAHKRWRRNDAAGTLARSEPGLRGRESDSGFRPPSGHWTSRPAALVAAFAATIAGTVATVASSAIDVAAALR